MWFMRDCNQKDGSSGWRKQLHVHQTLQSVPAKLCNSNQLSHPGKELSLNTAFLTLYIFIYLFRQLYPNHLYLYNILQLFVYVINFKCACVSQNTTQPEVPSASKINLKMTQKLQNNVSIAEIHLDFIF